MGFLFKLLHSIKERELAASQLLIVLGRKVNLILNENFNANTLAMLSTNLSSWLKSIVSFFLPVSFKTAKLVRTIHR
jgi:hypothetical protein